MSGKDIVDGFQYSPLFARCLSFKVEGPCTRALPLSSRTREEVDDKRGKSHANNQTRAGLYVIPLVVLAPRPVLSVSPWDGGKDEKGLGKGTLTQRVCPRLTTVSFRYTNRLM